MSSPSLHEVLDTPGDLTVSALLKAHTAQLGDVIETVGVKAAADRARLEPETVAEIADGDVSAAGDLDLETAASILALADGAPEAEDLVAEALEELLFGMSAGVLNVDVIAGEIDADLSPREVQGVLEGRHPVTLQEYITLQQFISSRAF